MMSINLRHSLTYRRLVERRLFFPPLLLVVLLTFSLSITSLAQEKEMNYPETPQIKVVDEYHGVKVVDNYQWMEDPGDSKVKNWAAEQNKVAKGVIDNIPCCDAIKERLNELWRYDDETVPHKVLNGERLFYHARKKDDEKWVLMTKKNEKADAEVLVNPNEWEKTETMQGLSISRDGKYIAYGKSTGGDENPVVQVMEVETRKILPDGLKGWKQHPLSWLPDNSGFFYVAQPLKGEVPEGEEHYWWTVYFHRLGTDTKDDRKIFFSPDNKDVYTSAQVTEDGEYVIFYYWHAYKTEVYYKKVSWREPIKPLITGFDAQYGVDIIDDKLFIMTNKDAPMQKMYVTDLDKPERENWKEFIPEDKEAKLYYTAPVNGKIYAVYQQNAFTRIKVYDFKGKHLRDMELPTMGSASVSGYWSRPEVWVRFTSFTYPPTTFQYDFDNDELVLYKEFPLDIDVNNFVAEQVWYDSKDGTPVSMFLLHRKDLRKDGNNPVLLTGYGGFDISMTPHFSTVNVVWLEAGVMIAIPNLRGGGEYGEEWHEAGMLGNKQNVFDDFIAAAEWLIDNKYTNPEKLAIEGASNGGLLVGAVTVQRPELFRAVHCGVPVLDMLRYHKFLTHRADEYGSSDDPEQFKYLLEYSPYHNVEDGVDYPAVLFTASENDARVPTFHAMKMTARMQEANPDDEPILLMVRDNSGHGGGTTISTLVEQVAEPMAFLLSQLGMNNPLRPPTKAGL
ncbi:S9 family peptidase [bacterium]|nr:S9 family peptidase [bacterium]